MNIGEIMSYVSVALAIVFWLLSARQANKAEQTLNEVKDAMITWQSELNRVSLDILSARPEVIAKQTSLENEKAKSEFSLKMAGLIEELTKKPAAPGDGGAYNINVIERLLEHQKAVSLGKEQIMAAAAAAQAAGAGSAEHENT